MLMLLMLLLLLLLPSTVRIGGGSLALPSRRDASGRHVVVAVVFVRGGCGGRRVAHAGVVGGVSATVV